jgi:hypothetical protein
MIIVTPKKTKRKSNTGYLIIETDTTPPCPICDGELCYRDNRLRLLNDAVGFVERYLLRRLRCVVCKKLHLEIPDNIVPYKHYDANAIQSVIDRKDGQLPDCAASMTTQRRWRAQFGVRKDDIGSALASIYGRTEDTIPPIHASESILTWLRHTNSTWLAFVIRLLVNAGFDVCTRFAPCPRAKSDNLLSAGKDPEKGEQKNDKTVNDTG